MKRIFTHAATGRMISSGLLSILLLASCAKPLKVDEQTEPKGEEEDLVTVIFSANSGMDTRAIGISDASESTINRWAIFVFDAVNGWYTHETSATGGSIPVTLRAGRTYDCYAMVNYATSGTGAFNPASVHTTADLTNKVAYLSDNAVGSLLMYGKTSITPSVVNYDPEDPSTLVSETKSINVTRIVSRIDVKKVAVDFSEKPALASKTFTLKHIYITNLYKTTRYSSDYSFLELSGSRTSWYNTGGWHRGEVEESSIDAIVGDRNINAAITASTPHTTVHSFYAFPNVTPKVSDSNETGIWTIRCTRIIIEATLDSETLYYHVDVPAMERNHIYSANNITIKGRGSNDPEANDVDPDVLDVDFSISADGWDGPAEIIENS